ncbi:DNA-processing protein DprA [Flavobacterium sp.]|jgi:DNA processing protein|uniref:DNA-processing protein DprA n=1 Tax=Flavobacterium sp. TaxID=239 RepID=UPI002A7ED65D|nr:DNA-processing protein DprA [Flavobacterium sp.]
MLQNELYHTLALLQVDGIGDVIAKKLIHHCGSAETVFQSKNTSLAKIEGIGKYLLKNLQDKTVFQKAEKELRFIEKENINILHFQDSDYPERLQNCFDAPTLLFQSGKIDLSNRKIISIVGTRQITSYGSSFTQKLIEDIAPLNPIIVSGFAYGVDIVAHQAAIDCGLQTIGVLAHGLNQIYPKNHKKYMAKMEENGGFLTEFWSTSQPDRENFVKRNRIVAGMTEATIVIESAEKGGSLITAQIANDYNRDVFAVPGRTTDKYSQGCNNLIKTQRAHLLHSAADLVYILNWELKKKEEKAIQKQLFVSLEPEEQKVYDYLLKTGKEDLDSIAIACELPTYKLSSLLLNMELKGVIKPLPGKLFETA